MISTKHAVFIAAVMLSGCASGPNQRQLASADYGQPTTPESCLTIAHEVISSRMKDPASAQFRNEAPCYRGHSNNVPLLGQSAKFGYVQDGEVNGKNSFGGYVGFRPYHVLIHNGAVLASCVTNADGICM